MNLVLHSWSFILFITITKLNREHSDKFEKEISKLVVMVHVLSCFAEDPTNKCTKNYNASTAQLLYCSFILLFSDVIPLLLLS